MSVEETINPTSCPEINPVYVFRWEEQEQAYLLLYPEGIVKLNNSAGHILKHCDGQRTIEDVVGELEREFDQKGLDEDVIKFMEVANDKGWIKLKA